MGGCPRLTRSDTLQRLFSIFAEGLPGIGLVTLRAVVGVHMLIRGICLLEGMSIHDPVMLVLALGLVEVCLGVVLMLGFLTPIAGFVSCAGYIAIVAQLLMKPEPVSGGDVSSALSLAAISAALMLLGPGAYSVDARLFGRREIIIPEAHHPPR